MWKPRRKRLRNERRERQRRQEEESQRLGPNGGRRSGGGYALPPDRGGVGLEMRENGNSVVIDINRGAETPVGVVSAISRHSRHQSEREYRQSNSYLRGDQRQRTVDGRNNYYVHDRDEDARSCSSESDTQCHNTFSRRARTRRGGRGISPQEEDEDGEKLSGLPHFTTTTTGDIVVGPTDVEGAEVSPSSLTGWKEKRRSFKGLLGGTFSGSGGSKTSSQAKRASTKSTSSWTPSFSFDITKFTRRKLKSGQGCIKRFEVDADTNIRTSVPPEHMAQNFSESRTIDTAAAQEGALSDDNIPGSATGRSMVGSALTGSTLSYFTPAPAISSRNARQSLTSQVSGVQSTQPQSQFQALTGALFSKAQFQSQTQSHRDTRHISATSNPQAKIDEKEEDSTAQSTATSASSISPPNSVPRSAAASAMSASLGASTSDLALAVVTSAGRSYRDLLSPISPSKPTRAHSQPTLQVDTSHSTPLQGRKRSEKAVASIPGITIPVPSPPLNVGASENTNAGRYSAYVDETTGKVEYYPRYPPGDISPKRLRHDPRASSGALGEPQEHGGDHFDPEREGDECLDLVTALETERRDRDHTIESFSPRARSILNRPIVLTGRDDDAANLYSQYTTNDEGMSSQNVTSTWWPHPIDDSKWDSVPIVPTSPSMDTPATIAAPTLIHTQPNLLPAPPPLSTTAAVASSMANRQSQWITTSIGTIRRLPDPPMSPTLSTGRQGPSPPPIAPARMSTSLLGGRVRPMSASGRPPLPLPPNRPSLLPKPVERQRPQTAPEYTSSPEEGVSQMANYLQLGNNSPFLVDWGGLSTIDPDPGAANATANANGAGTQTMPTNVVGNSFLNPTGDTSSPTEFGEGQEQGKQEGAIRVGQNSPPPLYQRYQSVMIRKGSVWARKAKDDGDDGPAAATSTSTRTNTEAESSTNSGGLGPPLRKAVFRLTPPSIKAPHRSEYESEVTRSTSQKSYLTEASFIDFGRRRETRRGRSARLSGDSAVTGVTGITETAESFVDPPEEIRMREKAARFSDAFGRRVEVPEVIEEIAWSSQSRQSDKEENEVADAKSKRKGKGKAAEVNEAASDGEQLYESPEVDLPPGPVSVRTSASTDANLSPPIISSEQSRYSFSRTSDINVHPLPHRLSVSTNALSSPDATEPKLRPPSVPRLLGSVSQPNVDSSSFPTSTRHPHRISNGTGKSQATSSNGNSNQKKPPSESQTETYSDIYFRKSSVDISSEWDGDNEGGGWDSGRDSTSNWFMVTGPNAAIRTSTSPTRVIAPSSSGATSSMASPLRVLGTPNTTTATTRNATMNSATAETWGTGTSTTAGRRMPQSTHRPALPIPFPDYELLSAKSRRPSPPILSKTPDRHPPITAPVVDLGISPPLAGQLGRTERCNSLPSVPTTLPLTFSGVQPIVTSPVSSTFPPPSSPTNFVRRVFGIARSTASPPPVSPTGDAPLTAGSTYSAFDENAFPRQSTSSQQGGLYHQSQSPASMQTQAQNRPSPLREQLPPSNPDPTHARVGSNTIFGFLRKENRERSRDARS